MTVGLGPGHHSNIEDISPKKMHHSVDVEEYLIQRI